jgi:hypothetical protein
MHKNFSNEQCRALQFWRKVKIGGWRACWPIQGTERAAGGVRVRWLGREKLVGKAAWEAFYGEPVPPRHRVEPRCQGGNACCNPRHLYLRPWGPTRPRPVTPRPPKLTEQQLDELEARFRGGEKLKQLAQLVGRHEATLCKALSRRRRAQRAA